MNPPLTLGDFYAPLQELGPRYRLQEFPPATWRNLPLKEVADFCALLADEADIPKDELLARFYTDFQTHHIRPLPTTMGIEAVEFYARLGLAQDPKGWIPLQVIGYGLILGHFLPTYPKPAIPDCMASYVLLEVQDYAGLQVRFAGIALRNLQDTLGTVCPRDFQVTQDAGPRVAIPFFIKFLPSEQGKLVAAQQLLAKNKEEVDWQWLAHRLDGNSALWCRSLRTRPNETLFQLIQIQSSRIGIADPTGLLLGKDELQFPPFRASQRDWALQTKALPLYVRGEVVVVGTPMADQDGIRSTILASLVGYRVFFCLISEASYVAMAPCWFDTKTSEVGKLAVDGEPIIPYDGKVVITVNAETAASDTNWTKAFVNQFIAQAVDKGASDIHVELMGEHFRLRFRIDGVLMEPYDRFPAAFTPFVIRRIKNLSNMDISNTREGLDGRMKVSYRGRSVDFRVATMPVNSAVGSESEACVLRILDSDSAPKRLEEVMFDEAQCQEMRKAIQMPTGMILTTGPTGCGKSTTLYAVLGELNKPETKIITIEDPVERRILGVNQTQVIEPNTFAKSLRMALRSDPDTILVGEIRDEETAELGIKAAQTGHMVLSTLHTNTALATVTRLNHLGIKYPDLATCLLLVTAQRLIRKVCPSCRLKAKVAPTTLQVFGGITSALLADGYLYEARGCPYCFGSGYRGRVAIMELLTITGTIKDLLGQSEISPRKLKDLAVSEGFVNLFHNGLLCVANGLTDLREVRTDLTDVYY